MTESPMAETFDWQGLPVSRISRAGMAEAFSGDIGSDRISDVVLEQIRNIDPDVCHLHHWHALSRGLVQELKADGRRVIVTLHDLFTTCMRFFRMPDPRHMCAIDSSFADCATCVSADLAGRSLAEIEEFAAERFAVFQDELASADLVFCVSKSQRDLLSSVPGFNFKKMETLPIGVPAIDGQQDTGPGRSEGPLRLVSWGGVEPRKGAHLLLSALSQTPDPSRFELHLHGEVSSAEYRAELEVAAAGLSVEFHGRYADTDLASFGRDYDLAVFPFIAFETYGLSVDEALHLGIPLLVCDRGAPQERIGGRGRLFPAEDSGALARLLAAVEEDRSELTNMRQASHHAILISDHVDRLLGRYKDS